MINYFTLDGCLPTAIRIVPGYIVIPECDAFSLERYFGGELGEVVIKHRDGEVNFLKLASTTEWTEEQLPLIRNREFVRHVYNALRKRLRAGYEIVGLRLEKITLIHYREEIPNDE